MSEQATAIDILREHRLRVTDCRKAILELFLLNDFALSQPDIERNVGEGYDRVTIYRTLGSFMENGVVHKVPDDSGAAKYALCQHDCGNHEHHDEHIHFKCLACGNTHCLDELSFPHFRAPDGYAFEDTNVLIQGKCPECNKVGE